MYARLFKGIKRALSNRPSIGKQEITLFTNYILQRHNIQSEINHLKNVTDVCSTQLLQFLNYRKML